MSIFILTSLLMSLTLSISLSSSPITLGTWIMFLAFCCAMLMNYLFSSWLAMFTFLIYVGGLLIMFSYFTATAPNQMHNFSQMSKFVMLLMLPTTTLLWHQHYMSIIPTKINHIMDTLNTTMFILLVLLLLLTLIATVKITQTNKGPLRKFNALSHSNYSPTT